MSELVSLLHGRRSKNGQASRWYVWSRLCASIALAWGALLGVACTTTDISHYEAVSKEVSSVPQVRPSEVQAGDVFEVRVYNEKALSGIHRVSTEGTIDFPLVGRVEVDGMSPSEIAERLTERLKDGYLRNPYVTVYVQQYNSKKVFVIGQVQKPGTFGFEDKMNVVQAITLAGGFTLQASKDEIVVTRTIDGQEVRISVPVEQISLGHAPNLALLPGDIIFVPESVL